MAHKISHPEAFWSAIFFKMSSVRHIVFNYFSQKLIRSSEIHIKPPQCDPTHNSLDIAPTMFLVGHFFKMSSVSHLFFHNISQKADQIIRNIQRTITSNLNAIQMTVHKISRLKKPFLVGRFFQNVYRRPSCF